MLADGRLPLDNTRAERSLRKVVVGRKNWDVLRQRHACPKRCCHLQPRRFVSLARHRPAALTSMKSCACSRTGPRSAISNSLPSTGRPPAPSSTQSSSKPGLCPFTIPAAV
ncbi:MAG: IS66 family transposase [Nitrospirota bacterium]